MAMISHQQDYSWSQASHPAVFKDAKAAASYATTGFERFLLFSISAILPLEETLPTFSGFTTLYLLFAFMALYVVLKRHRALARTWLHPVFLAAFAFVILIALIESAHPDPSYSSVLRLGQIFVAAIFIASLCRDPRALQVAIYGVLAAGVWMSGYLFLTSYGALSGAAASNFQEAQQLRNQTFAQNTLEANLNFMAFIAAQGTAVALALGLAAESSRRRMLFLLTAAFCFVSTFLPFSRSAIAIAVLACGAILLAYGIQQVKTLAVVVLLAIAMFSAVPSAVFSRLAVQTQDYSGKGDSRVKIYKNAVKNFPEYALTGVGAGNYAKAWAARNGYFSLDTRTSNSGIVRPPHSSYIAVTIYWGLGGFSAFALIVYLAYRCLPEGYGPNVLRLSLLGVATSLFLYNLVSDALYKKVFCIGLGLLVAGDVWIWPQLLRMPLPRRQIRRPRVLGRTT